MSRTMTKLEKLITELCPNGVEFRKLGEVAKILNGFAFKSGKYSKEGVRIIRISDVQKGKLSDKDLKYYPIESTQEISKYLLNRNDLVMSLTGNVGRVAMIPESALPAGLNQRVACIRPTDDVLVRFLFFIFDQDSFENIAMKNATGGGQKNMSTIWLSNFKIPVPPLEVQEEIVRILDNFTQLEAELEAELEARKKQYSHYRNALLSFENDEGMVGVKWKTLDKICDVRDGTHDTPKKTSFGKLLITSKNVKDGTIDSSTAYYISEKDFDEINKRSKVHR